jgi:hypothetical protein
MKYTVISQEIEFFITTAVRTSIPAEPVACLAYSSTLKMEATYSSETLADFQWNTRRYIPGDRILYNRRCENLKSYRACCLLGLLFDPEAGGSMFLRNVRKLLPDYTASYPRRQSTYSLLFLLALSCIAGWATASPFVPLSAEPKDSSIILGQGWARGFTLKQDVAISKWRWTGKLQEGNSVA